MSRAVSPAFVALAVNAATAPAPDVAAADAAAQNEEDRVYHEDVISNTRYNPIVGGYETTQTMVRTRSYLQDDGEAPRVVQTTTRVVTTVVREEVTGSIGDLDSDDDDDDEDYVDADDDTSIGSLSSDDMPLHPFPIDMLIGIAAASRAAAAATAAAPSAGTQPAAAATAAAAAAGPSTAAPTTAAPAAPRSFGPTCSCPGPSNAGSKRKACTCTVVFRRRPRTFIGPRRRPMYVCSSDEDAKAVAALASPEYEVVASV